MSLLKYLYVEDIYLKVSKRMIYRLAAAKKILALKLGGVALLKFRH